MITLISTTKILNTTIHYFIDIDVFAPQQHNNSTIEFIKLNLFSNMWIYAIEGQLLKQYIMLL